MTLKDLIEMAVADDNVDSIRVGADLLESTGAPGMAQVLRFVAGTLEGTEAPAWFVPDGQGGRKGFGIGLSGMRMETEVPPSWAHPPFEPESDYVFPAGPATTYVDLSLRVFEVTMKEGS